MERVPLNTLETDEMMDSAMESMEKAQFIVDSRSTYAETSPSSATATAGFAIPEGAEVQNVGSGRVFTSKGGNPIFGQDGASSMTDAEAGERIRRVLSGPYQKMMELFGGPLVINDAVAKDKTTRETKRPGSKHFDGIALDIDISRMSDEEKQRVLDAALQSGFRGIGLGEGVLHVDMRGTHTPWEYGNSDYGGIPIDKAKALVRNYEGGPVTPDDLMREGENDPYPNMTRAQKQEALADAQSFFNDMMKRQSEARSQQMNSEINQLKFAVQEGTASFTQLNDLRERYPEMDFETYNGLRKQIVDRNEEDVTLGRFANKIAGDAPINPNDAEVKDGYEIFSARQAVPSLDEQDADFVQQTLTPVIEKMGSVEKGVREQLATMARSSNPERMQFAFDTLRSIESASPKAWANLPEELKSDTRYYADMRRDYTQDELSDLMRARKTPGSDQAVQTLDDEVKEIQKDAPEFFRAAEVKSNLGLDEDTEVSDPIANQEIERQFMNRFRAEYRKYRDKDKAQQAAIDLMQDQWGTSRATGRPVLMQYPPEKFAPAFRGSHDYIREQLPEDLGPEVKKLFRKPNGDLPQENAEEVIANNGVTLTLVSDRQTQVDLSKGENPSYAVVAKTSEGIHNNLGQRYVPDVTEEMQNNLVETQARKNRDFRLSTQLDNLDMEIRNLRDDINRVRGTSGAKTEMEEVLSDLEAEREETKRELLELRQEDQGEETGRGPSFNPFTGEGPE